MARDIQDKVGDILSSDSARQLASLAVNEAFDMLGKRRSSGSRNGAKKLSRGISRSVQGARAAPGGARGVAAGAGAAALAPVAVKGIAKLVKGNGIGSIAEAPKNLAQGAASKLGDSVGDKVTGKIDDAGGPSGILKDTVKGALPFGGGGGTKNDARGVGKGRRMPVQQSVDVAVPLETAYNQWTQYEEWPKFMHRVTRVTQEDPCTVSFATKIWGKTKEFKAQIETQRPDERVKWKVSDGITHTGVVTFHELAPRLTRIELDLDVEPGSLIEKAARGMRHIKRAARGDLHRFKAFIEMLEHETGAWRGVIEDGEMVEDHDSSYDRNREYSSAEDLMPDSDDEQQDDDDEDEESGRGSGRGRSRSGGARAQQRRSSGSRSSSGRSSSGRSSSGSRASSRSSGGSSRSSSRSGSSRSSSGSSRSSSGSGRSSSGSSRSSGGSGRSSSRSGSSRSSSGSSRSSNGSGSSGSSRGSSRSSRSSSNGSGASSTRARSSRSSNGSSGSSGSRSSGRSRSGSGSRSSRSSGSSASHGGRQRSGSSRRS